MNTPTSNLLHLEQLTQAQADAISRFVRLQQTVDWRYRRAAILVGGALAATWLLRGFEYAKLLPGAIVLLGAGGLLRTHFHAHDSVRALERCGLPAQTVARLRALNLNDCDPWIKKTRDDAYTVTFKPRVH